MRPLGIFSGKYFQSFLALIPIHKKLAAGQQVTVTIPDGAVRRKSQRFFFENKIIITKSEFLNQVKRQELEQKSRAVSMLLLLVPADTFICLLLALMLPGSGFVEAAARKTNQDSLCSSYTVGDDPG